MFNLLKIGELPQDIINILVVVGSILFIAKHLKDWLEYYDSKRFNHMETLKNISENIPNKNYKEIFKKEQESMFFSLLTKRNIFSSAKRDVLLSLLKDEIMTKKDIQKYSYYFEINNGKVNIKISFFDYLEIWFLRFLSLYFLLLVIVFVLQLNQVQDIYESFYIIVIIFILMFVTASSFIASFKISKLKAIAQKIKEKNLYVKQNKK